MSRLLAISCTLASFFLFVIANASAYKTTITTVKFDDEPINCQDLVRRVDLSRCEQYVSQSRASWALGGIDNPQQQEVQECCQKISQIHRDCQCYALGTVVEKGQEQQRPERGQGQEEYGQVMSRASDIQTQCRLPEECQIRKDLF